MSLFSLVMLTVLSMVAGQQQPHPCCAGHKFTATIGEVGQTVTHSHGVHVEGIVRVTYDYDIKIMSLNASMLNPATGQFENSRLIQDYNHHTRYILAGSDCFTQAMPEPMIEPCIPANATFVTTVTFGSGQNTLTVNVWQLESPDGHGGTVNNKIGVTADCTPVMQNSNGYLMGPESDLTYFFSNFEKGITDRSVLVIPAAGTCRPLPEGGNPVGR